jgi:hypothetical protein
MAKKPVAKEEAVVVEAVVVETVADLPDGLPDEEVKAAELPAAVVTVVAAAPAPAVHFVSSMNNGSLMEANAAARAQFAERQAKMDEAQKVAHLAVSRAFAGTGAPVITAEMLGFK